MLWYLVFVPVYDLSVSLSLTLKKKTEREREKPECFLAFSKTEQGYRTTKSITLNGNVH